jgi:hypothetical protein
LVKCFGALFSDTEKREKSNRQPHFFNLPPVASSEKVKRRQQQKETKPAMRTSRNSQFRESLRSKHSMPPFAKPNEAALWSASCSSGLAVAGKEKQSTSSCFIQKQYYSL